MLSTPSNLKFSMGFTDLGNTLSMDAQQTPLAKPYSFLGGLARIAVLGIISAIKHSSECLQKP